MRRSQGYIGRFAPSPTGPLHAGSLVAALASWLDAKTHGGRWLLRMEDVDTTRCVPGAAGTITWQLAQCGLVSNEPMLVQSERGAAYQAALQQLQAAQLVYPCTCSRLDLQRHFEAKGMERERFAALAYPGMCRQKPATDAANTSRQAAWRLRTDAGALELPFFQRNWPPVQVSIASDATNLEVSWTDRRLGSQRQNLGQSVGDFVLKRSDGLWAYQLAVVVDDAAQGVTHVVRGEDLADNTPRQLWLQTCLGLPTPQYLHTPLVLGADGQKLSKQSGAQGLELGTEQAVLAALQDAAQALGIAAATQSAAHLAEFKAQAIAAWAQKWAN